MAGLLISGFGIAMNYLVAGTGVILSHRDDLPQRFARVQVRTAPAAYVLRCLRVGFVAGGVRHFEGQHVNLRIS